MKGVLARYWKILLILAILVGGIIFWANWSATQKIAASITTVNVQRQNFVKILSSSGKTKADKSVDLKFQTSGKLAWVGVKEGDAVRAYQAIAGLDIREVQKNLEKVLIDYNDQRNTFEDTRKYDYPANSPQDALTERMRHVLESNQWDLNKAILDVELKHLSVEFATLVTPIAGIITHIDTPVAGVNITPATAVFSVADPNSLVFEANVDETDIGGLTLGQVATITLDAFPEATFSGTISYISYISEQSSGGATVFPVKIAFADPQNLRIGLNGDIMVETDRQDNILTVPTESVREEKGGFYVYQKTDGKYKKVSVTVGKKNEDDIVILSGLSEGDTVVTKGFTNIPK